MSFLHPLLIASSLALLALAAICDLRTRLIPDWIPILLALLYIPFVLTAAVPPAWPAALATGGIMFLAGLVLFRLGVMGGGDVKLLSALSLWAGTAAIAELMLVTSLAGGLMAAAFLLRGNRTGELPYGVAIAAGGAALGFRLLAP